MKYKEISTNKNWNNSEYTRLIRIKASDLKYIKEEKESMSSAGFLNHIIQFYRKKKGK